ncbi:trigger factor [Candidatus Phytoplasma sacchari]|nr:trigger factor [Candidatus Phytoplasma sacchari]
MEVKKINGDSLQFCFRIYSNEFENYLNLAFDKIKDSIKIKGFRKGSVSRNIFSKKIGDRKLYKDALDILISKKIEDIIKNRDNFCIIGNPKLVNCEIENLDKSGFLDFSLEFALQPEVTLCDYNNIYLENIPKKKDITEEEIQNNINLLIKQNSFLILKDSHLPSEENDLVIFDLKIFYDENKKNKKSDLYDLSLEIGSNNFIPGFDEGIKGMKINEKRTFSLLIPDDFYDKEIASKKIFFEVLLKNIRVKSEFSLTNEFIKNMKIPDVKNINELKEKIKEKLEKKREIYIKQKKEDEILNFLIKNSFLNINKDLIIEEINYLKESFNQELKKNNLDINKYFALYNIDKDKFENNFEQQAIRNIKSYFILEKISKKEKIEILPDEIEKKCQEISLDYNISVEKIKDNFLLLQKIRKEILINKTISFLLKKLF